MRMSWSVQFSTWPIVSTPVTLGGGIMIVYGSRVASGRAPKAPACSQAAYHFFSTSRAS